MAMGFQFRQLLVPMVTTALLLLLLPLECLGFGVPITTMAVKSPLQQSIWRLFGSNNGNGKENDLFALYCEPDGLMTKETLTKVPMIAEMLVRGIYVATVNVFESSTSTSNKHTHTHTHTHTYILFILTNDDETRSRITPRYSNAGHIDPKRGQI
jgi:hypothetical protein